MTVNKSGIVIDDNTKISLGWAITGLTGMLATVFIAGMTYSSIGNTKDVVKVHDDFIKEQVKLNAAVATDLALIKNAVVKK